MMLTNACWHKKIAGNTAADVDVSEVVGDAIDTTALGCFSRARLIIELGTVTDTAVITAALMTCDTSDGSYEAAADLGEDGYLATGKSDKTIIIDAPVNARYLKYAYQRTVEDIELDGIFLELYDPDAQPIAQDSGVCKTVIV